MLNFASSFDLSDVLRVDDHLRVMPRLLQTALKRREAPLRRMVLDVVAVEGKPVDYPIQWTSENQRKAFFATDGFGRGIPTGRTGDITAGWRAAFAFTPDGGGFSVWNNADGVEFVQGQYQQPMFADRWVNAPNALDEFAPVVIHDVEQTVITATDPFAGVPPP